MKQTSNYFEVYIFLVAKDYRTMASGWQVAPYSRKYGRELVSKPAISLKKKLGGTARDFLLHPLTHRGMGLLPVLSLHFFGPNSF